jgi:arsenate reductase-like glutaredoxin family protein
MAMALRTTSTTTRKRALTGRGSRRGARRSAGRRCSTAGATFRKLPDGDKQGLGEEKAIDLMLVQPSLIKRPVLEHGGSKLLVGFKPEVYQEALAP